MFKRLLGSRCNVVRFVAVSSILTMLLVSFGFSSPAFAASRNSATHTVTGTVTAIPAGMPATSNNQDPVAISLETSLSITNFIKRKFTVEIIDQATGAQILSQLEETDDNGNNNDYHLIPTQQQFATIPPTGPNTGWKVEIKGSGLTPVSTWIDSNSGIATFTPNPTGTTTGTSSTASTSTINVTGSVEVINDTDVFPVSIQLQIHRLAGQQVSVDIVSQSQGQILHRSELVESQTGAIDDTVSLQPFFSFDPNNDWTVQITDANGNTSSMPMSANGQVATATFAPAATN
jgi:hypothetical protein